MVKKSIPNVLTFLNLSFGVLAILEIVGGSYFISGVFLICAAVVDRYDGRIARFLNVSSTLGKELDSLADLVSFGVAPALLIFCKFNFLDLGHIKGIGICVLLLYVISGSYRLAKYNIGHFDNVFIGMPITVAGFILAVYSLAAPINSAFTMGSVVLLLFLACFMVSKYKFNKR
ncbi:CDP-diacylglycerol--serine O-phosphatidyltransferase [Paenibacillus riograndensis]|uniref:CDP-diacylglycerol--serine O-phosphatidyltransferase n=1 Tax=Paenibacillus riograndensis TaxID=483937 RepID=A0A132U377_9BACL|nr:CDP-alcohol phosphatidyltransferase family protein [Paenibacillus riograndensis]KWX77999.1 CDP-diacylglycerol--serine O-phosphatidyltransferase [Paenibacillus riograndensis]KWX86421.1 CDP-diacylglycerol--serine O-phosphatidyltransferase [Paenibacillus riograndensis]